MNNNEIFNQQLHLLGLRSEFVQYLFARQGVSATKSLIKGWRTDINNSRSTKIPDDILQTFFQSLFEYRDEMKDQGIEVFVFPRPKKQNPE